MRIIGGSFRGRKFRPPSSYKGRPTTDFAREALFNLLNSRVDLTESSMLDLFSGTGGIALEAISRGVREVIVIEKDPKACAFIKQCIDTLEFKKARVIRDEVIRFIYKTGASFDFVFADPPYDFDLMAEMPARAKESNILKPGGLFVLEHGEDHRFDEAEGFIEMRKYGAVHFSFFTFEA